VDHQVQVLIHSLADASGWDWRENTRLQNERLLVSIDLQTLALHARAGMEKSSLQVLSLNNPMRRSRMCRLHRDMLGGVHQYHGLRVPWAASCLNWSP
jgi:hypothetical protein